MFQIIRWEIAFFFFNWRCTWWISIMLITPEEAQEIEVMLVKEMIRINKEEKEKEKD